MLKQQRGKELREFPPQSAETRDLVLVPIISQEDRVEQLLIEYKETPNPSLMLYFFEQGETRWQCPCGHENYQTEDFCGNCGVAKSWLEEHTAPTYLAIKIIARKGENAVRWQSEEAGADPFPYAYETRRSGTADVRTRVDQRVDTKLADYEGGPFTRFFNYMIRFGSRERRILLLSVGLILLFILATIVVRVFSQ